MSKFVDRIEQYVGSEDSKVLIWMFSGYGASNDTPRKVLLLRLSPQEFTMFSSKKKNETVYDVFQRIYSTLSYPAARILMVNRIPHYESSSADFTVSSTLDFNTVFQQMNNAFSKETIVERVVTNG